MAVLDETSWQEEYYDYEHGKFKKVKDAKGKSRIRKPKSKAKVPEDVDQLYDDVNYGLNDLTPDAKIINQMLEDNVMVRGRNPKRWASATNNADTVRNIDFSTVHILHGMGIHVPRLNDPLCHLVEKLKLCAVIIQSGQSLAVAINTIRPTIPDDCLDNLHMAQLSITEKTIYMSWRSGKFEIPELEEDHVHQIHWTDMSMQEELDTWEEPFAYLYPMQVVSRKQVAFLRTKTDWATPLASAIVKRKNLEQVINTGLEHQPNLQPDSIGRYISVQYAEEVSAANFIRAKAQWHMKTCRAWDKIFPDSKDFESEVSADMQAARLLCTHLQDYADTIRSTTQDPRERTDGKQMLKVCAMELSKSTFFASSQSLDGDKENSTNQATIDRAHRDMIHRVTNPAMPETGAKPYILKKRKGITSMTEDTTDLEIWRRTLNYNQLGAKRLRRRAKSLCHEPK